MELLNILIKQNKLGYSNGSKQICNCFDTMNVSNEIRRLIDQHVEFTLTRTKTNYFL